MPILEPFFKVLKLFKCLLGAFLSLLFSSGKHLDPKNNETLMVFQGFRKCSFLGQNIYAEICSDSESVVLLLENYILCKNDIIFI